MPEILVRTPLTENGTMPVIGPDGRQVYTENILQEAARKGIEKWNEKLPTALRSIILPVGEPEPVKEKVADTSGENTVTKVSKKKHEVPA